jgi:hypothetical protein
MLRLVEDVTLQKLAILLYRKSLGKQTILSRSSLKVNEYTDPPIFQPILHKNWLFVVDILLITHLRIRQSVLFIPLRSGSLSGIIWSHLVLLWILLISTWIVVIPTV